MRKNLCATILVLALCGSALAGDVSTPPLVRPDNVPKPLTVPQIYSEQTDDGVPQDDNADGVAAAAMSILNSVLALL